MQKRQVSDHWDRQVQTHTSNFLFLFVISYSSPKASYQQGTEYITAEQQTLSSTGMHLRQALLSSKRTKGYLRVHVHTAS